MTKISGQKPNKTTPLSQEMISFLGKTQTTTKGINDQLLILMPASEVELTSVGNAPAIPVVKKSTSDSEIGKIITVLGGYQAIMQGIVSIAGFVAKEIDGSLSGNLSFEDDVSAFGKKVKNLFKNGVLNQAAESLMQNLGTKQIQAMSKIAVKTLTASENKAVENATNDATSALGSGPDSDSGSLLTGTIDMATLLILMFSLNSKLKRAEQDAAVTTSNLQASELRNAAKKTKESALDAFYGALSGSILTIATAGASGAMGLKGGMNDSKQLAEVQNQVGEKPLGVIDTKPVVPSDPLDSSDPLGLSETVALGEPTAKELQDDFIVNRDTVEDTLNDAVREKPTDVDKSYLYNGNGSLNEDGIQAYSKVRSDFENHVKGKGIVGKVAVGVRDRLMPDFVAKKTGALFDDNGNLTATGKTELNKYTAALPAPKGDAINDLLQYTPDQLNQMVGYPAKSANYLQYTVEIKAATGDKLTELTTQRAALKQESLDYDKRAQPIRDQVSNNARSRANVMQVLTQLSGSVSQTLQSGVDIKSKTDQADAQKKQADAGVIGATKQNIDGTVQNIDAMLNQLIGLLSQYLQGKNQAASNAARLV